MLMDVVFVVLQHLTMKPLIIEFGAGGVHTPYSRLHLAY